MAADTDPLERHGPQTELPLQLVQLGATRDVHGLALREPELQAVEGRAGDRDLERRPGLRVLQREEDVRPGRVAAELLDLALDPERGQPAEEACDPAIECGDGVDLAIPVEQRLDLRHGSG